jgi:hypothetical protein
MTENTHSISKNYLELFAINPLPSTLATNDQPTYQPSSPSFATTAQLLPSFLSFLPPCLSPSLILFWQYWGLKLGLQGFNT